MTRRLSPLGPLALVTSPLLRCQETAAGLARAWKVEPRIEPGVAEIPSPEGVAMADRVEWLRLECSPCHEPTCRFGHNRCMTDIRPETVFAQLRQSMQITRRDIR